MFRHQKLANAIESLLPAALLFSASLALPEAAPAQTWTQTAAPITNLFWSSVCSSTTGDQIFAVARTPDSPYDGPICQSFDSGNTWSTNAMFDRPWAAIACSADGSKLAAVGANDTVIYLSTNSGVTWTPSPSIPEVVWTSLASSADGTKLAGAGTGGINNSTNSGIYTSTNSGINWSLAANTSGKIWTSTASSANGSRLVAAALNDSIYTSSDSGVTWVSNNLPKETWAAVTCSSDGNTLAAAGGGFNMNPGPICVSTNFGATWATSSAPVLDWAALASSADGQKMIALKAGGNRSNAIFTSTDRGFTWTSNTVPAVYEWTSVASSADGSKLMAASAYGGIWTWQSTPAPQLNLASSSNGLTLSWILPSTNFVLEENSDLTTANWMIVTNIPKLNLSTLDEEVVFRASNSSGFFRLTAQ